MLGHSDTCKIGNVSEGIGEPQYTRGLTNSNDPTRGFLIVLEAVKRYATPYRSHKNYDGAADVKEERNPILEGQKCADNCDLD